MAQFIRNKKEAEHKSTEPKKPFMSYQTKKKLKRAGIALAIAAGIGLAFATWMYVSAFYDKFAFRYQSPIIIQSPVIVYDRQEVIEAEIAQRIKEMGGTVTNEAVSTKSAEAQAQEAEAGVEVSTTPVPTKEAPKYINFNLVPKVYADTFEGNPSNTNEAKIINSTKHPEIIWRIYMLESTFGRNDACKNKGLVNGFGFAIHTANNRCYSSFEAVVADVDAWVDDKYSKGWNTATILCYYNRGIKTQDCPYAKNFLTIK